MERLPRHGYERSYPDIYLSCPANLCPKSWFLDLVEAGIKGSDDADCGGDNVVSIAVRAWGKEKPVLIGDQASYVILADIVVDETYTDYDVAIISNCHWTSNPSEGEYFFDQIRPLYLLHPV